MKQQNAFITANTSNLTQIQNDISTTRNTLPTIQSEQTTQNTKIDTIAQIQKIQTDILTLQKNTANYQTIIDDLTLHLEHAQAGIDVLTAMSVHNTTDFTALLAINPDRLVVRDVDAAGGVTNNITLAGIMAAQRVATDEIVITGDEKGATIGAATIAKDTTDVFVSTSAVTEASRIFVTPKGGVADQMLSVSSIDGGSGFHVTVASPVKEDVAFDWLIIYDDVQRQASVAPDVSAEVLTPDAATATDTVPATDAAMPSDTPTP